MKMILFELLPEEEAAIVHHRIVVVWVLVCRVRQAKLFEVYEEFCIVILHGYY